MRAGYGDVADSVNENEIDLTAWMDNLAAIRA
jgi:hypothetical protein